MRGLFERGGARHARAGIAALGVLLYAAGAMAAEPAAGPSEDLLRELKNVPFAIVFETFRDGNWELYQVNADGSQPRNLTRTPLVNEMYPHVSPDGRRVSFTVDEGEGAAKRRNTHVMNLDGAGRRLVATDAREPCSAPPSSPASIPCWSRPGGAQSKTD